MLPLSVKKVNFFVVMVSIYVELIVGEHFQVSHSETNFVQQINHIHAKLKYSRELKANVNTFKELLDFDGLHYIKTDLRSLLDESNVCYKKLIMWINALNNTNELWAQQVFDSFGKPNSGILKGQIVWPGDYSECMRISADNWQGKYCYVGKKTELLFTILVK